MRSACYLRISPSIHAGRQITAALRPMLDQIYREDPTEHPLVFVDVTREDPSYQDLRAFRESWQAMLDPIAAIQTIHLPSFETIGSDDLVWQSFVHAIQQGDVIVSLQQPDPLTGQSIFPPDYWPEARAPEVPAAAPLDGEGVSLPGE